MPPSKATPPSSKDNAEFGLYCDEVWILRCYDLLKASQFNFPAIFGLSYVELPSYLASDIQALSRRQGQLEAMKPKS